MDFKQTNQNSGNVINMDESLRSRISQLEAEVATAKDEYDKFYQRAKAEYDSYRREAASLREENAKMQDQAKFALDQLDQYAYEISSLRTLHEEVLKKMDAKSDEIERLKLSLSERDEALREAHGLFSDIAHPACPSNFKKACDCQLCEVERLGWKIEKMLGIGPTTAERLG